MLVKHVINIYTCVLLVFSLSSMAAFADNLQKDLDASAPIEQPYSINNTSSAGASEVISDGEKPNKQGFFSGLWGQVVKTYNSPQAELYLPVYIWHNRKMWTRNKIDSFNEIPGGMGYGKYRNDADGDSHELYSMVFLDSHGDPEISFGYAFEKLYHPSQNWRFGGGFTVGSTFRKDYKYLPIPVLLPIVSFGYRRLSLEATYIPGGKNQGNVLFTWIRWSL